MIEIGTRTGASEEGVLGAIVFEYISYFFANLLSFINFFAKELLLSFSQKQVFFYLLNNYVGVSNVAIVVILVVFLWSQYL